MATRVKFGLNEDSKKVAEDLVGDALISTMFIGVNNVLFELVIFGGEFSGTQEHYNTYEDSIVAHKTWVKKLKDVAQA
jgi:hypothetical protein